MQLRQQLYTFRQQNMSVSDYVEQKRNIANMLVALNDTIRDFELARFILMGLEPKFGPFITSINVLPITPCVDDLVGMLLQEEERLESSTQATIHSAYAVEHTPSNSNSSSSS